MGHHLFRFKLSLNVKRESSFIDRIVNCRLPTISLFQTRVKRRKHSSGVDVKRPRTSAQTPNFDEDNSIDDDPIDVNKFLANDGVRIKEERNFDDSASLNDYDRVPDLALVLARGRPYVASWSWGSRILWRQYQSLITKKRDNLSGVQNMT